jgi:hypothetical protein
MVAVRQVKPGVRLRLPVWIGPNAPDVEALAHAVFDLAHDAMRAGKTHVPPDVLKQHALMLAEARRA